MCFTYLTYLKTQYCPNNSWPGHEVILVAFYDNYGEDSFNERLYKVSKPPQNLWTVGIHYALIKGEKNKGNKTPKNNEKKIHFAEDLVDKPM